MMLETLLGRKNNEMKGGVTEVWDVGFHHFLCDSVYFIVGNECEELTSGWTEYLA